MGGTRNEDCCRAIGADGRVGLSKISSKDALLLVQHRERFAYSERA